MIKGLSQLVSVINVPLVIECLDEVYVPKGETAEIDEDKEKKKPTKKKSKKKKDKGRLVNISNSSLHLFCTHIMN